jgi:hypothetical protein
MAAMNIDVHVSGGGSIVGGEVREDAATVARCTICAREVDVAASLGKDAYACAACLRDRLDAMSIARFRLRDGRNSKLPWGKVTA